MSAYVESLFAYRDYCLGDFVDWLFDVGPDPASVTREQLLELYEAARKEGEDDLMAS